MLALTLECQRVVCELHVDVLFDTPRQLGREDEGIVGLVEVDRWPPGARLALGAARRVRGTGGLGPHGWILELGLGSTPRGHGAPLLPAIALRSMGETDQLAGDIALLN